MTTRRVIVIGAGIGGCATALALQRAGIDTEIWEKHPASTEDRGAFLGLVTGGVVGLRELGVLDAVDRHAALLPLFRFVDVEGNVVWERPAGDGTEATRLITRQALCDELQAAVLDAGIPLRWATQATSARLDGGTVRVHPSSGEPTTADLVVAADGLRSSWRTEVNPDDGPPRYTGQNLFYGRSSWTPPTPCSEVFHVGGVDGFSFGYICTASATWWFARITGEPQDEDAPDFDVLRRVATGVPGEIIAASTARWMVNSYDLPAVTRWSRGGVVLLGDAAHAASPATGQGASTAVEDGIVLAKALRDRPDVDRAVATYERARRGRTQANIVASAAQSTPHAPLDWADQGRALAPDELREQLAWDRVLPG